MSRVKIKVGDSFLDTFNNIDDVFYITSQVYDLHSLQERKALYTRQIEIPTTTNNLSALERLTNETLGNKSYQCVLSIDGINFGISRLLVVRNTQVSIEIIIFAGNFELFDSIADTSIKDISSLDLDFPWTLSALSANAASTDGIVTLTTSWLDEFEFLENLDGNRYKNEMNIKLFGFHLFMKTLFEIIVNEAGYTVDDTAMTSDNLYNNLVLACPVNAFVEQATETEYFGEWNRSTTQNILSSARVEFNNLVQDDDTMYDNVLYEYEIPEDNTWTVQFYYDIDVLHDKPNSQTTLQIFLGGSLIDFVTFDADGFYSGMISGEVSAIAGDKAYCYVDQSNTLDSCSILGSPNRFILKTASSVGSGDLVVSKYLPDITRKTFITSFVSMINCFIKADPFSKVVELIPFSAMLSATPQDLTNNVDDSQPIQEEAGIDGYYRASEMKFNNDSDVVRTDTNYIVDFLSDEALPLFGTILNPIFSASDNTKLLGVTTLEESITMPYYEAEFEDKEGVSYTISTDLFQFDASNKAVDFKPGDYLHTPHGTYKITQKTGLLTGRIFETFTATASSVDCKILKITYNELGPRFGVRDITNSGPFSITDNGWLTGNSTNITTVYNCNINEATMTQIYNNYYKSLFDSFQAPKVLLVWMVFNTVEFNNLDLFTPVYIKHLNGIFYINKIEQFKLNAPCRVELIRINDLSPSTF